LVAPSPVDLLQTLTRFDTTNPPGNEAECVGYIDGLLREAGFSTSILASAPARPNLITRLEGRGQAPPLLVHGHVDVVTTAGQDWTHPPFSGDIVDGAIWGRGTLDMKGDVAMLLSALLEMKANGERPPGDVILAVLADEEAGSDFGARLLVQKHADLFKGVRYSLGEGGGTSVELGSRRIYPVGVAEKRVCWMHAVVRGPGGHGSMPIFGGTMSKLRNLLNALDSRWLPVHLTPVALATLETLATHLPEPMAAQMRELSNPERTDEVLARMGDAARVFGPVLHNTVSVTGVRAGVKINVIPSEADVQLDGRLLPGYQAADLLDEIRAVVGPDVELHVDRTESGPATHDPAMLGLFEEVIGEEDPDAVLVPVMIAGFTDGCQFARLGIQNYGFLPARMPAGFEWEATIHGADERMPVEALEFGVRALHKLLTRFGG
jgi:acetylornithine deacetylase/succinyl-diaminopimelate desuccinylase-like protein